MSEVAFPAVYLTYAPRDAAAARLLKKELAHQGVAVESFNTSEKRIKPARTREAIAQSEAVIVLATSSSIKTTNLPFEVGAAQVWDKPIYVVTKDIAISILPDYLKEFHVFAANDIKKLAARIHEKMEDEQRSNGSRVKRF